MRIALPLLSAPALALAAAIALGTPAHAAGAFTEFNGSWSGSGTIRPQGGSPERIRCHASFKQIGGSNLDAKMKCASDSYKFDLTGQFSADSSNSISGRWTENSRGVGGTVSGTARGDSMQVVVDSSGFSATLQLVVRGRRCEVTIESQAGGEPVKANITMNRS